MTWFSQYQHHPAVSLIYLLGIVLMIPALLVYYVGCSFWCLVIVLGGKLSPKHPYPEAELS